MDRIADGIIVEAMQLCLAEGDDGYETGAEVLRLAFPKLHAAIEAASEGVESPDFEEALPEGALRKALHAELERFVTGSWRRARLGKKTDSISRLAHEMDLPVKLAHKYEKIAREQQGNERAVPEQPKEKRAVESPLFGVSNHQTENCGQAPSVDGNEAGEYYGYFANQFGEQAVFVYDYKTDEASVRMGDTDWHNVHRVVDGRVEGVIQTMGIPLVAGRGFEPADAASSGLVGVVNETFAKTFWKDQNPSDAVCGKRSRIRVIAG